MSAVAIARGERASARQVAGQLWSASRGLSVLVAGWVVLNALGPAAVVATLGIAVGAVPGAIREGMSSPTGERLIIALVVAAIVYGLSLVLAPIGTALGTAAKARITGALQARLLTAVSGPVGIDHLEDPAVLDRLSRAEGSLTGYFPGDAPVTWAGILSSRISGFVGCVVIALYCWWLALLLFAMWIFVRRLMLRAILRQATEMRGQTTTLRRAWYLAGIGSKARDAKEVRVFGLGGFIADRFHAEYSETIRSGDAGLRDVHRRAALGFCVVILGYLVALTVIAHDVITTGLGVQQLAILLPMLTVTMQTGSVSMDDITLTWSLAAIPDVDRLEKELGSADAGHDGRVRTAQDGAAAAPLGARPTRSVAFRDVAFRYATGATDVLTGVDLELEVGTSTAIVGGNGAGKSTLVSLLSRLHDPTRGSIVIDGEDIRGIDPVRWQRAVAVMPQDPAHFPVSARDNIAFGAIEHGDDQAGIEDVARQAGFLDIVQTLPNGWDTLLSRALPGGVDLSGGQWQRLALARALFATRHGARLLVLDEPTAALDVRGESRFYEQFLDITHGLTTVVISHRFATVRRADTICVLEGGRIGERGSHDELVAAGGTYARLYGIQARQFGSGR